MSLADQSTLGRVLPVPVVIVLFLADFHGHDYWARAVFIVAMTTDWFDGRVARRRGRTSELGSLLDPWGVFPAWMVAAIVAREFLVSGLRLRRSSAAWLCAPATSAS